MQKGPAICIPAWVLILVLVVPGTGVFAGDPGDVNGSETDDPCWMADPGWCCVMEQSDVDEDYWWTGVTFYEVYYRTDGSDGWNKYVREMTIPWLGIQMQGGNMVRYEHSQDTSAYHLYFDGTSYTYHTYTPQQPWTSLGVDYILDFDGDSNWEWKFWQYIEFNPPAQGNTGYLKIEFQVKVHPQGWVFNQTNIQTMEIPFLINPDVYDNTVNDFYNSSDGGDSWSQVTSESVFTGTDMLAKAVNEVPDPDVELIITPIPQGCNPANQIFTYLHYEGNEYSRSPGDYDDNDGLEGNDGLIWYVESYNVQVNPPPNAGNGGATGIKCDGFVA